MDISTAWIEVHQELRNHPKVIRLANNLNILPITATGALLNLWLWAVQYAPSGDITAFSDSEIGDACILPIKKHDGLVKILIKSGWLDEKSSKIFLHDWKDHGLKFLLSVRERVRKHRENKKLEEEERSFSNVTITATVPNLTVPNLTLTDIYNIILSQWNNFAKSTHLTTVIKLTDKRKIGIRRRLQEPEFNLMKIFTLIKQSTFLLGEKGWKVDFDFVFCSQSGYLKILEGKYNNGKDPMGSQLLDAVSPVKSSKETNVPYYCANCEKNVPADHRCPDTSGKG